MKKSRVLYYYIMFVYNEEFKVTYSLRFCMIFTLKEGGYAKDKDIYYIYILYL